MTSVGYRNLAAGQHPGAERDRAEQVEFLRSLGTPGPPSDSRTGL